MPTPQLIQHILLGLTFFFLLASFSRKVYFACAYLLIMMNRPGLYYPVLAHIRFELIVAVWAIVLLAMGWGTLLSINNDKIVRNMWIFLIVILLSMLQAFSFFVSWDWVYENVLPDVLVALLILMFCRGEKEIKLFLWIFVIALIGLGYEAVYRYVTGNVVGLNATGIGGFQYAVGEGRAGNHNSVANYFLTCMPLLWYMGISSKKISIKLIGSTLLALSFSGTLISGSRGGMVGLVCLIIIIAMLSDKPMIFLAGAVIILAVSIPFMGGAYLNRMSTILHGPSSDASANNRILGLIHGIEMMIKRPILGVGPGCYPGARKAWFGWGLWAHNLYGQLSGELGVIGVVVWFRFAKEYLGRSWQLIKGSDVHPWIKEVSSAIFVTSVVWLALGMFDHSLYNFVWYILATVTVRLAMLADKNKKN